jgi:hypothetical protein
MAYYQDGKCLKTLVLSKAQWQQRIKNAFWRNIHNNHISGSEIGIAHDLYDCVVETEMDTGNVIIALDRYKELYKTAGVRA